MASEVRAAQDFLSGFDKDGDGVISAAEGEAMARALAERQALNRSLGTSEDQEARVIKLVPVGLRAGVSHRFALRYA